MTDLLKLSLEERRQKSERIRSRYPDRVPIVLKSDRSLDIKKKYIVPGDMTLLEFLIDIKQVDKVSSSLRGKPLNRKHTLFQVCQDHGSDDGFLYIQLASNLDEQCNVCCISWRMNSGTKILDPESLNVEGYAKFQGLFCQGEGM